MLAEAMHQQAQAYLNLRDPSGFVPSDYAIAGFSKKTRGNVRRKKKLLTPFFFLKSSTYPPIVRSKTFFGKLWERGIASLSASVIFNSNNSKQFWATPIYIYKFFYLHTLEHLTP